MTKSETDISGVSRPSIPRALLVGGLVLAAMLTIAGCGDDDDSGGDDGGAPEAAALGYQDAMNAGDMDAVEALFVDDALWQNHPISGTITGSQEIRAVSERVLAFGSPGDMYLYADFESADPTSSQAVAAVSFSSEFRNDEGECFYAEGNLVEVNDEGLVVLWVASDDSDEAPDDC